MSGWKYAERAVLSGSRHPAGQQLRTVWRRVQLVQWLKYTRKKAMFSGRTKTASLPSDFSRIPDVQFSLGCVQGACVLPLNLISLSPMSLTCLFAGEATTWLSVVQQCILFCTLELGGLTGWCSQTCSSMLLAQLRKQMRLVCCSTLARCCSMELR